MRVFQMPILLLAVMTFSSIFVLWATVAAGEDAVSIMESDNNTKDLITEIPDTGESPLALKTHAVDEMGGLNALGENTQFAEIIEHLKRSIGNNFWDNYHIKSGEAFKEDKQAAQKMKVLLDSESYAANDKIILECLIMLLQADKKLAGRAMEDAKSALLYTHDPVAVDEISRGIENAAADYNKAGEHVQNGDVVVALEFFANAWEHAIEAILIADRNTAPKVNLSSPLDGSFTNTSQQIISGSVEDVAVHTIKNVTLTVNEITSEIPLLAGSFSQQVALVEGNNNISITAVDAFGNSGAAAASIVLDTIAPEIRITGVEDEEYYNRNVQPEINILDVNLRSSSAILDGIPYLRTPVAEEGTHMLEVYATDLAGNGAYALVNFTIDKTPPKAEITNPLNNSYLSKTIAISGSVTDLNLDGYYIEIDNTEVSRSLPYSWDTTKYEDGNHTIELYAQDKALNNDSVTLSVTIDNTPPIVNFVNPLNNSYLSSNYLSLLWSGADNYGIAIYELFLNNRLLERTTATEKALENLEDRLYETTVQAFDFANNSASNTVFFTIDTIPPWIKITGAEDGRYYNTSVLPQINITDINLNFSVITLNKARYNGEIINDEGRHSLSVYTEDLAGNNATLLLNFTIDKTPPAASLDISENPHLNKTVVVKGSATDINFEKVSLSINGVVVANSLPYTWNTSQFPDGAYAIELSAIDKAGNSNIASRNVTIDNTHPSVSIIEPQDGAFVRGKIQINGTAVDANLGAVSLKIDSSAVSSVLPYTWDTSGYSDGVQIIELSAVDKAGNGASTTITVIVDNTLPEVTLAEPANGSYVSDIVTIDGSAADSNLNRTSLSIDDIEVSSSLPYYWNTTDYPDGKHTISFSAWDMAGNEAAVEITVTLDNTAPIVSIISPLDGALLRQTVEINGSITEMDTYLISLKIDGASVASSIPYLWDTSAYTDGTHRIELNVSDKASNYAEASINVTIDNTPPLLAVSELNLNPTLGNAEYSLLITAEADAIIDVNNEPVALDNGSGIYRTNVTSGINEFTVTAIDLAGNPSIWKRTILVDEDTLPDWYEINVTGTDPLDGDSDSPLTLADEADNGIKDDIEDFDSDRLSNREEFAYGIDPFKSDTEGDGLNDWYELRITRTNPLLLDSDNNSVNDQKEDEDGDMLDNLIEQEYNTNPMSNDTDEDSLSDYREITELKTDPLKKDTDGDFLDDSIELKPFFNTDPNNPDTNNNEIPDGNETYEQTIGNKTLGIEVVINASDNREGTFIFEDVGDKLKIDSDVFIGKPINILNREKFSNMKIKMRYDGTGITNESDLGIFYFDEKNHSFVLLENQSVNTEENYISAETNHLSDFISGSKQNFANQFQNSNAPTIPELRAGDEIKINARVHNIGKGDAKDVRIDFYNGDPDKGGVLIGTNVTPSIGGNRSALVSVNWKVNFNHSMNIFVKIDPSSAVVETREDNNIAGRFLDNKSIDSDSDGLTDYDEVNGLRTGMFITFFTDPNNPDSDGDGLDDGKEMGRVMNGSEGRYYYLFSYPNLTDTDGDKLSDKDEYYFGSSGINKDTDGDGLNDFDEKKFETLPNDPDTDKDGLTDWWETVTDSSINKYGATDPKNRDSDFDGSIDGGESNVYIGTLYLGMAVDTNMDGVADSGEMDLDGNGIIEMGEENYYETPPNNYTYFVDVFMVVDEDYKDSLWMPWDPNRWKDISTSAIKDAGKYFLSTFQVKLNILQIYDGWDSDDNEKSSTVLLEEVEVETNWIGSDKGADNHNSDILVAFTGQDPGLISKFYGDSLGLAFPWDAAAINRIPPFAYELSDNLAQHEISHLFGADDYFDGRSSIMDKSSPWPVGETWGKIWTTHEWDNESFNIIESNKSEVSLFSDGGDYDITN